MSGMQPLQDREMTIDERLEKLAERHEALTQTVELMAAENRAGFARLQQVEQILGHMAQSMDTLARVVELHEHRIDDLESHA
jgi:predicted nuclease with TOPRIM domain